MITAALMISIGNNKAARNAFKNLLSHLNSNLSSKQLFRITSGSVLRIHMNSAKSIGVNDQIANAVKKYPSDTVCSYIELVSIMCSFAQGSVLMGQEMYIPKSMGATIIPGVAHSS